MQYAIKDTKTQRLVWRVVNRAGDVETMTFSTAKAARIYRDTYLEPIPSRYIVVNHPGEAC